MWSTLALVMWLVVVSAFWVVVGFWVARICENEYAAKAEDAFSGHEADVRQGKENSAISYTRDRDI